jgi:hypothetical protein
LAVWRNLHRFASGAVWRAPPARFARALPALLDIASRLALTYRVLGLNEPDSRCCSRSCRGQSAGHLALGGEGALPTPFQSSMMLELGKP